MSTELGQQFFNMLVASQYWTMAAFRDHQQDQLENLLRFARANVPYYRDRLAPVFDAHDRLDWSKWTDLPLIKRADLIEHGEDMQPAELPPGHGRRTRWRTSGSSGEPVEVATSSLAGLADRCAFWRMQTWHRADWAGVLVSRSTDDPEQAKWPEGEAAGPWGPPWDATALKGANFKITRATPPDKMLEFLQRKNAKTVLAAPKGIHMLALESRRLGIELSLDLILCVAERTEDQDRDIVRDTFGARIAQTYSSKESHQVAYDCPEGHGLHVNSELVRVEIIDDEGNPCPPGQIGRIVTTALYNAAQPLIRYEQGDRAAFLPQCPCGRGLPLITPVAGRMTTIFTHPSGATSYNRLPEAKRAPLGVRMWQVAQIGPIAFEIRYVPRDAQSGIDQDGLRELFHQTYFSDAELRLIEKPSLNLGRSGKLVEYLNEWAQSK